VSITPAGALRVPHNTPESDSDDNMTAPAPSDAQIRLQAARRTEQKVRRLLQEAEDQASASAIEASLALNHRAGTLLPTPPLSPPAASRSRLFDWTSSLSPRMSQLTLNSGPDPTPTPAAPTDIPDPYGWLQNAGK
jgi:hypothetical protein